MTQAQATHRYTRTQWWCCCCSRCIILRQKLCIQFRRKSAGIYDVLAASRTEIVQNTPIYTVFCECVENTVFRNAFSKRGLTCIVNTGVFFTFITSSSGICSVLTRQRVQIFSVRAFRKHSFLALCLASLIRTQEGVKPQNIAKLNLKWIFCLSQSLPQSSNSKS